MASLSKKRRWTPALPGCWNLDARTPPAAADLEQISDYLLQRYPRLAQPTVLRIYNSIKTLKTSPYRGRIGTRRGTRELVLTPLPYLVVYRIQEQVIEILHIHHGAQNMSLSAEDAG